MNDPYRTLGVSRTASQDEVRKAFKKLARKYHPDVSKEPGAEDKFREVNQAYSAVGDTESRKNWDEFGEASQRPGFDPNQARQFRNFGGGGGNPFGGGGGFAGGADMDDLLSSLFGGGTPGRGRARRGQDQRARLQVTFLTSILGGEEEVTVSRPGGSTETLKVRIPAGIKDGGRLKLKGRGMPPPGGGPCGDLQLDLQVGPHPTLRRKSDSDLEMDLPITIYEAMAGTSLTVPTPTGDVKISVPAGVKPGQKLRLKGRGVQKKVPGHLYLVLLPTPPKSEDPAMMAAAQALESAYVEDVRAALRR